jgi:hydroxymethylbilane synthase
LSRLRIGSRGSVLALWQANFVRGELQRQGVDSEVVIIKTAGDRIQDAPVAQIGLKGVFIKELEDALLEGKVDLAVHSMKDVPTEVPAGLNFPAICKRHDPSDVLLSRSGAGLRQLAAGARVGTSSLRRQAQLRRVRPDLDFLELRGNVDTRIRKLESGEYDAIVLAKAGLDRLGLSGKITEVLATEDCLPAVGQGTVGIEARAGDIRVWGVVAPLDHEATRVALAAERALLAFLEGGCQVPLGALATVAGDELSLLGCVVSPNGKELLRDMKAGSAKEPEAVGRQLGAALIEQGAGRILQLAGRTGFNA